MSREKSDLEAASTARPAKGIGVARVPASSPGATQRRADKFLIAPSLSGALAIDAAARGLIGEPLSNEELAGVTDALRRAAVRTHDGDMRTVEASLLVQAKALEALFVNMLDRATAQSQLPQLQAYMGLALKAQAQSRATLQALIEAKQPRSFIVARQANVAAGHQQVNNGVATSPRAPANAFTESANELLEPAHEQSQRVDTGAPSAPARGDPAVEAVGVVDGPTQRRRKGASSAERAQARGAKR